MFLLSFFFGGGGGRAAIELAAILDARAKYGGQFCYRPVRSLLDPPPKAAATQAIMVYCFNVCSLCNTPRLLVNVHDHARSRKLHVELYPKVLRSLRCCRHLRSKDFSEWKTSCFTRKIRSWGIHITLFVG